MRCLLQLCWLAAALFGQGSDVVISQVYGGGGNAGAPLANDFVELFNRGRTSVDLTGWSVQYASGSGTTWQVTPLHGTIAPGRHYLVQQAAGANAQLPGLPAPDATGAISIGATSGKVALSRSTAALSGSRPQGVEDFVGYGEANGFEGSGPARAPSNATAALRRNAGCTDSGDNLNDFQIAEPVPRNSQAGPAVDCSAPPPEPSRLRISEIQGSGARSPVAGQLVTTTGVVTGRSQNGFWIQSLPADIDADGTTSEGLFVFFGRTPPPSTVVKGAVLRVTGTVSEFRPASDPGSQTLTEIVDASSMVVSQGQTLPPAVELRPEVDWERYEGMRVSAPALRAVGPTLASLNESTNTSTATGVFFAVAAAEPRPYRAINPEGEFQMLRVDSRAQGGPAVDVTAGTAVRNVSGPLDYAFRTWTVAQDMDTPVEVGPLRGVVTAHTPLQPEFVVASMNLERLFDTTDDPGTSDPVVTEPALTARVEKIARVIRDVLRMPDIIAVQEAENIDVLRAVATAAGGYDAHLLEGNDIGGIDTGFLTRRGRAAVQSLTQEGRNIRQGGGFLWDRPPLIARMSVQGVEFTAIAVHLRSLLDADDPAVAAKRRAQAEGLRDLVRARATAGEQVLVLGDFNMYQFDPLMDTIRSGGPLTLLTDTLPPHENYSYVFDGVSQTLDHILLSAGLRRRLVRTEYIRINADFPAGWRGDLARVERYSDHDVPVVYMSLVPDLLQISPASVTNAATFLSGSVAPGELLTIFGRGFGPDSRVSFDGLPVTPYYAGSSQVNVIAPVRLQARSSTTIRIATGDAMTNSVVVPVARASPGIFVISREAGRNQGAILNEDSSVNGPANPAVHGSVIQIFATGVVADRGSVAVRIGGRPAEVLFAGQAPGLLAGVIQLNARVPEDAAPGDVTIVLSQEESSSPWGVVAAVR
jgi:uncharacterized protein (TIGR03437 family)